MKRVFTVLALLWASVAFGQKISGEAKPKKDKLVIAIGDNGTENRLEAIKPLAAYLSNVLKMEVTAITTKREVDLLKLVHSQEVDIAFTNSFCYVLGISDSLPIVPLVIPGYADNTPSTYNSCIVSAAAKNISSIDQLVSDANKLSFMFVNATSTSGHLLPRLYMSKLGLREAESNFRELSFGNNHYTTLEKILAGEVDAGAVAYNILQSKIASGEIKKEDVNILWVSVPITQTPAIINRNMDSSLKRKVEAALLKLHKKDPALWAHVQKTFSAPEAIKYVKGKDEHYNSLRTISSNIEDLQFILNYYID